MDLPDAAELDRAFALWWTSIRELPAMREKLIGVSRETAKYIWLSGVEHGADAVIKR